MLHWLSQIVWRREHEVLVPVELLCLHVALECIKLEIIPVERSLVQLIANEQERVAFNVDRGKKLNMKLLKRTGFFVIPEFVEVKDCVSELRQRAKASVRLSKGHTTMTIDDCRPPLRR